MLVRSRLRMFAALAAFSLAAVPAQAQTTLRYQFKEGAKTKSEMVQKMVMKMDVAGQEVEMKITQMIDLEEKVLSVGKDGKAKVAQRITRWRMEMDMPPPIGKVQLDSQNDKEEENPLAQVMKPIMAGMVNLDFTMTLSPQGETTDLKMPAKFLEMLKTNPVPGMEQTFSEESMRQIMTQGALVLPKEAVTKGKTWKTTQEAKSPPFGKMINTLTSTYQGPVTQKGQQLEKIGLKSDIKLVIDEDTPAKVKMKLEKAEGSALFDNKAGRIVETQQSQVMIMEIEAGDQTVNMRVEVTATVKAKK